MRLINLPSKMLAAIGYNSQTQELVAQFQSNGTFYLYQGVPEGVFVRVITNPISIGAAFNEFIRGGGYPYEIIPAEGVKTR